MSERMAGIKTWVVRDRRGTLVFPEKWDAGLCSLW